MPKTQLRCTDLDDGKILEVEVTRGSLLMVWQNVPHRLNAYLPQIVGGDQSTSKSTSMHIVRFLGKL